MASLLGPFETVITNQARGEDDEEKKNKIEDRVLFFFARGINKVGRERKATRISLRRRRRR